MFHWTDRPLLILRIVVIVNIVLGIVASFVVGIVCAVRFSWWYFFVITIFGWFGCFSSWVFWRVIFSFLCDVKVIRNKLYGENNEGLEVFLKPRSERVGSSEIEKRNEVLREELRHLQTLMNAGVISREEYEKRKKELTKEK